MQTIGAALAALFSVWLLNRFFLKVLGDGAYVYAGPLVEELAKTLWAVAWGGSIITAHLFFGMAEALQDIYLNRKTGFLPGLFSIMTHFGLGVMTFFLLNRFRNLLFALLMAVIAHMIWNGLVRTRTVKN